MQKVNSYNKLRGSTQFSRSKDFGSRVVLDDYDGPSKENENFNYGRFTEERKGNMTSSRHGKNREERNENLECKEDFIRAECIYQGNPNKRNVYSHSRVFSESQEGMEFFRYSHNGRPNQIPARASFKKQEKVRTSFDHTVDSRSLMRGKSPTTVNTLKGCSSNQDLRSTGFLEKDLTQSSMRMSKMTTMLECANKDGKKAKYRIIDSEEEEQLFYCSKCSIMLLQQGFQVQKLDNSVQDPHINRTLKRKSEVQHLNSKIRDLQSNLKKYATNLEDHKYFVAIEQQRSRVAEVYDFLLHSIQQLKESQLKNLQLTRQSLVSDINKQKGVLFGKFTGLQTVRDDLEEIGKNISKIGDSEYSMAIKESMELIKEGESYQPLQFQINTEKFEHKTEKLIQHLADLLRSRYRNQEQFSFDKSNASFHQQAQQQTKHPFRTLFPEDLKKGKLHKITSKNYLPSQSIEQCYEDSFASNISARLDE